MSGTRRTSVQHVSCIHAGAEVRAVNGTGLYYEVHGSGRPLVLPHGGLLTVELNFGAMIPTLAKSHKVIAVEMQGHGHTADIDRR